MISENVLALSHRTRWLTGLAVIALLAACSAPAAAPSAPPASTLAPIKLKVPYLQFFAYAPYFIADKEGFFAAEGLSVELTPVSSMGQGLPALLQGDLDVLAGTLVPGYLNAIARGGHIAFVADKGYIDPAGCATSGILARSSLVKTAPLDSAERLRGLTVNGTATGIGGYMLEKFLTPKGLTVDDLKYKAVPDEILSESLGKGALDLAFISEPFMNRILQDQSGILAASAEQLIPNFQYAMIIFGPNLLDKNPQAGNRFMAAYLRAVRQYNQGKTDRNLDILTQATGLDREVLRKMCWQPIRGDGRMDVPSIMDFQSFLVRRKLLDAPVTEESKLVDLRFINYANQILGK